MGKNFLESPFFRKGVPPKKNSKNSGVKIFGKGVCKKAPIFWGKFFASNCVPPF